METNLNEGLGRNDAERLRQYGERVQLRLCLPPGSSAGAQRREITRVHQEVPWTAEDLGRSAPCEKCGRPGTVMRGWPSMGEQSPIVARCPEHEPEDDHT